MLCPVCRHDNFEGEDTCTNCGADLSAADVPQPAIEFHDTILGSHLDALGVGRARASSSPASRSRDAIRRMHDAGTDCLLVCERDRLVGIFTDRDAVVKVAGKGVGRRRGARVHDPRPGGAASGRPTRRRHPQDGRGRVPARPGGRRGRAPDGVVSAADVFRHIVAALG